MTPINRRRVKIRQFIQDIDSDLKYEQTIIFQGKGQVVKKEGKNNQDSTQDIDYIVKVDQAEIKKADFDTSKPVSITNETRIKEKSRSQALRHKAFAIAQEYGTSEESLYNSAMTTADDYLINWADEQGTK